MTFLHRIVWKTIIYLKLAFGVSVLVCHLLEICFSLFCLCCGYLERKGDAVWTKSPFFEYGTKLKKKFFSRKPLIKFNNIPKHLCIEVIKKMSGRVRLYKMASTCRKMDELVKDTMGKYRIPLPHYTVAFKQQPDGKFADPMLYVLSNFMNNRWSNTGPQEALRLKYIVSLANLEPYAFDSMYIHADAISDSHDLEKSCLIDSLRKAHIRCKTVALIGLRDKTLVSQILKEIAELENIIIDYEEMDLSIIEEDIFENKNISIWNNSSSGFTFSKIPMALKGLELTTADDLRAMLFDFLEGIQAHDTHPNLMKMTVRNLSGRQRLLNTLDAYAIWAPVLGSLSHKIHREIPRMYLLKSPTRFMFIVSRNPNIHKVFFCSTKEEVVAEIKKQLVLAFYWSDYLPTIGRWIIMYSFDRTVASNLAKYGFTGLDLRTLWVDGKKKSLSDIYMGIVQALRFS